MVSIEHSSTSFLKLIKLSVMVAMFIMYAFTETGNASHRTYDIVMFIVSLAFLGSHYYLGKHFLVSTGNALVDTLSFVLIIAIAAIYIQRTPSGIISGPYYIFLTFYGFLKPFFGDSIWRIGLGVLLSCIAQYLGLLSRVQ